MKELVTQEAIEGRIFLIRSHNVMVDRDLAELYGVETKYLNRQIRNNIRRFPEEFMFRLTKEEKDELVTFCHRFETMKHSMKEFGRSLRRFDSLWRLRQRSRGA